MFKELDSLKVKTAKVNKLNVYKEFYKKDTLDFANSMWNILMIRISPWEALKKCPIYFIINLQDEKEFKFYFLDFYSQPLKKDSTSVGVTK
jgi:hypothetical protein